MKKRKGLHPLVGAIIGIVFVVAIGTIISCMFFVHCFGIGEAPVSAETSGPVETSPEPEPYISPEEMKNLTKTEEYVETTVKDESGNIVLEVSEGDAYRIYVAYDSVSYLKEFRDSTIRDVYVADYIPISLRWNDDIQLEKAYGICFGTTRGLQVRDRYNSYSIPATYDSFDDFTGSVDCFGIEGYESNYEVRVDNLDDEKLEIKVFYKDCRQVVHDHNILLNKGVSIEDVPSSSCNSLSWGEECSQFGFVNQTVELICKDSSFEWEMEEKLRERYLAIPEIENEPKCEEKLVRKETWVVASTVEEARETVGRDDAGFWCMTEELDGREGFNCNFFWEEVETVCD